MVDWGDFISSQSSHFCNKNKKIASISRGANAIEKMFGTGKKKKIKNKKSS